MARIRGKRSDDTLSGGASNDLIYGMGGNDQLLGLAGDDRLYGGDGDDVLVGGAGNDTLDGGKGADEYQHSGTSADGDDVIEGGDALDKIVFTTPDLLDFDFERDGNDLIVGILNADTEEFDGTLRIVNHYAGSAIGFVQADFASLNLEYGTDPELSTIYFTPDLANGIDNTTSSEILLGSSAGDVINGNGGYFDFLSGHDGDDIIHGGDGFDNIRGGDGNDQLFGDADNDVMRGDRGDDYLDGGDGYDLVRYDGTTVTGGVFVDLEAGVAQDLDGVDDNVGHDVFVNFENVRGSQFGDQVLGDEGANFLSGLGGDDQMSGRGGGDYLSGAAGDDSLFGEADSDSLDGGDGNDFLAGGVGDDLLNGGAGADGFGFDLGVLGADTDTLTSFEHANDYLSFTGIGDQNSDNSIDLADLLTLVSDVSDDGSNVVVNFTTGAGVVFAGVGTGSITQLTEMVDDASSQIIVS